MKSDKFSHIANNNLLKNLSIPVGYYVNNDNLINPYPILYNNLSDSIDDKYFNECFKLVEINDSDYNSTKPKKSKKNKKNKKNQKNKTTKKPKK
tara:strand:+ start:2023 stop:2304 length:282 start_codon:yes stop_codon:yes gene_type:complete